MKCLIVLALVAAAQAAPQYFSVPTVLPSGHLADTPEVAFAKVAHFAEHAKALAAGPAPITPVVSHVAAAPYYKSYYSGPYAIPTVLPDGHLADTAEVAAAKVAHFAEQAKALAAAPGPVAPVVAAAPAVVPYYKSYYSGPYAIPTVLPDGHLADTPEVAAAKVAHFAEQAKALATAPGPVAPVVAAAPAVIPTPYYKSYYSGPYAIPTVLPDGHLADTPEVAAAKAFHYSEHAKALTHAF